MLASILGGAASGLVSSGVQQLFTDYNREQDFGNYQKAVEQSFVNAQDAQRNAPLLTKLGMQAAGLNPAQMNNPTPVTGGPAPLGNHASPSVNLAQDNYAMAQSRLANAEAEKTELQNERTVAENESSFENYTQQVKSLINAYRSRGWSDQADALQEEMDNLERLKSEGKLSWNVGNLKGAVNAFSTVDALQERLTNTFDQLLKTETNFKMLVNGAAVPLSKMPELQRQFLVKQMANYVAQTALLASQKNLTDEQKNECVKLQEKLQSEIDEAVARKELTEVQAKSIRLSDWKQLLNDGDFMAAVIAKADEQQKIILEQTGQLVGAGAHAYAGNRMAKGMSRQGTGTVHSTTVNYDNRGKPKGTSVTHMNSSNRSTMLKDGIPMDDVTW